MTEQYGGTEFEPPYPDPESWPADEAIYPDEDWKYIQQHLIREAKREHARLNELRGKELLNGASEIGLFENVEIIEETNGDRFVVPPRFLYTPRYGIWKLEVSGRVHWFKELSDYGDLSFTADGTGGWIPHLYPFEEIDKRGVPVIADRERAEVRVTLERMHDGDGSGMESSIDHSLKLATAAGIFIGKESIETWNGDENHILFDDYEQSERELYATQVRFGPKYSNAYEIGEQNDWEGKARGSIWVPMDLLRAGIDPMITFPLFAGSVGEIQLSYEKSSDFAWDRRDTRE